MLFRSLKSRMPEGACESTGRMGQQRPSYQVHAPGHSTSHWGWGGLRSRLFPATITACHPIPAPPPPAMDAGALSDLAGSSGNVKYGPLRTRNKPKGFPGGAVVKNPPANAGDTGLIPGPGRSHMPRST